MAKVMLTKKQQAQKRQQKLQEDAKLARLRKDVGRDAKSGRPATYEKVDRELSAPTKSILEDRNTKAHKSMLTEAAPEWEIFEFEYENFEEREKAAQEEIERKKLRVAPLFNKGGYQYISDDMDPTTFGKKL